MPTTLDLFQRSRQCLLISATSTAVRIKSAEGKQEYKSLSDFLQHWSMQELYNRKNYLALQRDTERAEAPLAAHYSKRSICLLLWRTIMLKQR